MSIDPKEMRTGGAHDDDSMMSRDGGETLIVDPSAWNWPMLEPAGRD